MRTFVDEKSTKGIPDDGSSTLPGDKWNPTDGETKGLRIPKEHSKGRDNILPSTVLNNPPGTGGDMSKLPIRTLPQEGEEYGVPWKNNVAPRRTQVNASGIALAFLMQREAPYNPLPGDVYEPPRDFDDYKPPGHTLTRREPDAPGSGSAKVIPPNDGMVNKEATILLRERLSHSLQVRYAMKIAEIEESVDPDIHDRSQDLTVHKIGNGDDTTAYHVAGGEDPHLVYLQRTPEDDVRVSCDCNYWRWQGPEHWASVGGYLYGSPIGTATKPAIRDPNDTHRACKHVLAVFRYVHEGMV